MATAGLSLVGFMDAQAQALHHLRTACVPPDPADAALIQVWNTAKAKLKLGAPIPNAGRPDIQSIKSPHDSYIQGLRQQQWVQGNFQLFGYQAAEFKLVEIAPLLAFQFIVDAARSDHHCAALKNPRIDDLLPICLPQAQPKFPDVNPLVDPQTQSMTIKARNLSLQQMNAGAFTQNGYESIVVGIQIHVALPFVHVVRFNGRCYLYNGFHRAYGAAKAGATHIPCLLRDVATAEDAGIRPEATIWLTFPLRLLEAANPPTLGHFSQGRA